MSGSLKYPVGAGQLNVSESCPETPNNRLIPTEINSKPNKNIKKSDYLNFLILLSNFHL